jgi:hypothetical protein
LCGKCGPLSLWRPNHGQVVASLEIQSEIDLLTRN